MIVCYHVTTFAKHIVWFGKSVRKHMLSHVCVVSQSPSNSRCLCFHSGQYRPLLRLQPSKGLPCQSCFSSAFSEPGESRHPPTMKSAMISLAAKRMCPASSLRRHNVSLRLSTASRLTERVSKFNWSMKSTTWLQGGVSAGLIFGSCVCFLNFKPVYAEAATARSDEKGDCDSSVANSSHGKKVHINYSITGIPGDGRCLFRSVVHGACLRSGKPSPNENIQRELADDLRNRVADEFIKRRAETEWFIEGDFDTYISQIRKPHVWGGEPELLMASHVLQMPIAVYIHDESSGGLIAIAEYGQEYGKENPIQVLYHGYGHYDALQIPGKGGASRL